MGSSAASIDLIKVEKKFADENFELPDKNKRKTQAESKKFCTT